MRALILAAGIALWTGAATAQQDAIQDVIGDQITAFRADDFDAAFDHAAPGIRGMFGTSENFGRMVREGYPMVWRPGSVEYLPARQSGVGWMQEVLVTDADGRLHKLAYLMVQTPDGWKIAGVQLLTAPEVGA
ncbi:MAG: DUF4864 domain-containing protein [Jannaschia sp.]